MNQQLITLSVFLTSVLFSNGGQAENADQANVNNAATQEQKGRWRFGMSLAPMLNIDTEFSGLGGFVNPLPVQPIAAGTTYNYDNGFVGVDVSGNAGGETWNWGYENASQYDPTGGGSINYSISNSAANARASDNGETAPGIDLFAYYEMDDVILPSSLSSYKAKWGLRFGLHAAEANFRNGATLSSGVTSTNDRFALNGTIPPVAPYAGLFDPGIGGAPLLSDNPTRNATSSASGALITGSRALDLFVTTFGVGPYLELQVNEKCNVFFEGGVNLALTHGDYFQTSSTTISGVGTQNTATSAEETELLMGVYLGTSLSYQLSDDFSLYGSMRYQLLDQFEVRAGSSSAETSFGGALILSFGVMYQY